MIGLAINATTSTTAPAAAGPPVMLLLELGIILVTVGGAALYLVLTSNKNKVLILDRVRPYIWTVIQGKYDPVKRKLTWPGKHQVEIPKKQELDMVRPPSKFRYLAVRVKGRMVQLGDQDIAAKAQAAAAGTPGQAAPDQGDLAVSPLIDPEDLPQDEERKSLVAMLTLKIPKSDLIFYLLIGVGMGVFMGLFFGNFYHPGYVPAPPAGYEYQLHAIPQNVTSTTSTTSSLFP